MIYLFDNREILIHIFKESDVISFVHTKAINKFDEAKFELPVSDEFKRYFDRAIYFAFFDGDVFRVMKMTSFKVVDTLEVSGIDRAEYDLRTVSVIKSRRFRKADVSRCLEVICDNSLFSPGIVSGISRTATLSFYYISPMEALVKVCEVYGCEFLVRYTFSNNRIVSRYIDLYKRVGKVSGKQFYHGSDLLKLRYEQSNDEIVTALVGRGKGEAIGNGYGRRIEFNFNGRNYLTKDELLPVYGIFKDGVYHHRFDVFVDENIEDRQELLEATRAELERRCRPKVVYEADVLSVGSDLSLGDSVAIVRDDLGISFQARVFEMSIDKLSSDRSTLKLGDYDVLVNPTFRKIQSATKSLVEDSAVATGEAVSGMIAESSQAFNEKLEELKSNFKTEFDEKQRLFSLELDNKILSAKNDANVYADGIKATIDDKIASADISEKVRSEFSKSLEASKTELSEFVASSKALSDRFESAKSELRGLVSDTGVIDRKVSEAKSEIGASIGRDLAMVRGEIELAKNSLYAKINSQFNSLSVGRNYILNSDVCITSGTKYFQLSSDISFADLVGKSVVLSCDVEGSSISLIGSGIKRFGAFFSLNKENNQRFWGEVWETQTRGNLVKKRISKVITISENIGLNNCGISIQGLRGCKVCNPKLEIGSVATDWCPAVEEGGPSNISFSEFEKYKRERDEADRGVSDTLTKLSGKFDSDGGLKELAIYKSEVSQTAQGVSNSIRELVDYKNKDGSRRTEILNSVRSQTAGQISSEISKLSNVYLAKNVFTETVDGINRRFESISVGGRNYYKGTRNFRGAYWVNLSNWVKQTELYNGLEVVKNKNTWNGLYQVVNVKAGEVWTFSFYAKADTENTTARIYTFRGAYEAPLPTPNVRNITLGSDWKRYVFTFTVNRDSRLQVRVETVANLSFMYLSGLKLEKGSIVTDWSPAPEDEEDVISSKIAEYRQTVDGQIATVRGLADSGIAKVSRVEQSLGGISQSISSLESGVLKKSDVSITDSSIVLGTGKVVDGGKLASMISVSPEGVSVITDRFVVKPGNENLVDGSYLSFGNRVLYSKEFSSEERRVWVSSWHNFSPVGLEFLVRFKSIKDRASMGGINNSNRQVLNLVLDVKYGNGFTWERSEALIQPSVSVLSDGVVSFKVVEPSWVRSRAGMYNAFSFRIGIGQSASGNFQYRYVEGLEVFVKKSAEFIVDGSITSRQIMAGAIEAGNIKAGAITSSHIASNAIEAGNIKAGAIGADKLFVDQAFISKLTANNFLANYVKTLELDARKITSGFISADRISGGSITGISIRGSTVSGGVVSGATVRGGVIDGAIIQGSSKIKIGEYGYLQPASDTLQINVPESLNSKRGIGVQIKGGYGGLSKSSPYGVFIYADSDLTTGGSAESSTANLLHVQGFIDTKGIDNLVFKKYMNDEMSLHLWNTGTNPVELLFERSPRDISYYWRNSSGSVEKYSLYYGLKAALSDERVKENIVDCDYSALALVDKFRFKSFGWRDLGRGSDKYTKVGLIAQDVMRLDSSLVRKQGDYYALEDFRLLNVALKCIQELSSEVRLLKEKLYV